MKDELINEASITLFDMFIVKSAILDSAYIVRKSD